MIAQLPAPPAMPRAEAHRPNVPVHPILNHCSSAEIESDYKGNRCIGVES